MEHPRHPPIDVALRDWTFVAASEGRELGRWPLGRLRDVADALADRLRHGPRERRTLAPLSSVPHPWIIAGHLLEHRDRVLRRADPRVAAVWAATSAEAEVPSDVVFARELYDDPWIVRDVLRWRAAAIALAHVETTLRPADAADTPAFLAALRRWPALFAPDGVPYRSLHRTLMNLPRDVPASVVCALRRVRLERPLVDAVELCATGIAADAYAAPDRAGDVAASHRRIWHHARRAEIVAAVARVAAETDRRLDPRQAGDVATIVRFVADCPEPFGGRLAGLVDRALRWHRLDAREREDVHDAGGIDAPARRPPIPLPREPGITFLDRVGAIGAEGERMHSCVAGYAASAVDGWCYLFHVEHAGEHATVEVSPRGEVVQAEGPCNTENRAARWGRQRLALWGRGLLSERERAFLAARDAQRRLRFAATDVRPDGDAPA